MGNEESNMTTTEAILALVLFVPLVLYKSFVMAKVYAMFALQEVFGIFITTKHWIGIGFVLSLLIIKKSESKNSFMDMISVIIAVSMVWGFSALIKLIIG